MRRAGSARPDPYAVLGVAPSATGAEITAAFRRAVRALHPDTGRESPFDQDKFEHLLSAYAALHSTGQPPGDTPVPKAAPTGAATAAPPHRGDHVVIGASPWTAAHRRLLLAVGPVRVDRAPP